MVHSDFVRDTIGRAFESDRRMTDLFLNTADDTAKQVSQEKQGPKCRALEQLDNMDDRQFLRGIEVWGLERIVRLFLPSRVVLVRGKAKWHRLKNLRG